MNDWTNKQINEWLIASLIKLVYTTWSDPCSETHNTAEHVDEIKVPVVFASLASDGLQCWLSQHRSSIEQPALRDASNSAECEMTSLFFKHIHRYTKLALHTHTSQCKCTMSYWTELTELPVLHSIYFLCSSDSLTMHCRNGSRVCVRRRELLHISDLVLLSVYWVIWVAKKIKNTAVQIWSVAK